MLDHLSGGRLEIGLARGSNPAEVETIGIAGAEDAAAVSRST